MPSAIAGYRRYDGLMHDETRAFDGMGAATPLSFRAQMDHCADTMWTARWRTLIPDVKVYAIREPSDGDTVHYRVDMTKLGAPATAGYLAGTICQRPGFVFARALNGNGSNPVDVVVDWQYWDAAP
jgi:hypothetical protein